MKNIFSLTVAAALASCMAFSAQAAGIEVQPHHKNVLTDCAICHTQENAVGGNAFVIPADKTCIGCHGGYDVLAKKTANLSEPNPHASHHYGKNISCTACHKEHQKPAAYCNECHGFNYKLGK